MERKKRDELPLKCVRASQFIRFKSCRVYVYTPSACITFGSRIEGGQEEKGKLFNVRKSGSFFFFLLFSFFFFFCTTTTVVYTDIPIDMYVSSCFPRRACILCGIHDAYSA